MGWGDIICAGLALAAESAGFLLCTWVAERYDRTFWGRRLRLRWPQLVTGAILAGLNACPVAFICHGGCCGPPDVLRAAYLGMVAGGLLYACFTDMRCRRVYDYVWWGVLILGTLLLLASVDFDLVLWRQLSCFFLLQRFLFDRCYGRADVYAFCACALMLGAFGGGMREYLLQMAAAFLFLFLVQLFHRNIGRDGNLKVPVAFLPYIVVSFWLTLLWIHWRG